jgi:hypothetical protein
MQTNVTMGSFPSTSLRSCRKWMARVHHQSANVMSTTTARGRILFFGIPLLPILTKHSVCLIGVKLNEHYHNGFLRPTFPNLVKGLANFGHPIQFYPSLSTHHYDGMHSIYNAEGACHLPSFRDLDFSLLFKMVNGVPLDAK